MNEEQFQRHVDFILAQQAKSEEHLARHEQLFSRLAGMISGLANYNETQDERVAESDRRIAENNKQIAALIEAGKETDKRFKETDERINILIKVAERFYSGNGN